MKGNAGISMSNLRDTIVSAFERKFGKPPSRIQLAILREGDKEEIMSTFGAESPTSPGVNTLAGRMRSVYLDAFKRVHNRTPSNEELEAVMAVGRHETIFATAKFRGGVGPGMHNHGAVQCCKPTDGGCPDNAFLSQDTTPSPNGGDVVYSVCFKRYASDLDGAADLIRIVGNKPLALLKATGGSISGFAAGMYLQGYFESTNASQATTDKYKPVISAIQKIGIGDARGVPGNVRAGRVLVYALGLDKSADTNAKELKGKRYTTLTIPFMAGVGLVSMLGMLAVAFGLWKLTSTPKRGTLAP